MRKIALFLCLLFAVGMFDSCAHKGYKPRKGKRIKRGKAIPCPIKDC